MTERPLPSIVPPTQIVMSVPRKEVGTAYLLWFFFGALGVQHFWMGKPKRGVLYLLTLGLLTIGVWVDLFTLPRQVRAVNRRLLAEAQLQQAQRAVQAQPMRPELEA